MNFSFSFAVTILLRHGHPSSSPQERVIGGLDGAGEGEDGNALAQICLFPFNTLPWLTLDFYHWPVHQPQITEGKLELSSPFSRSFYLFIFVLTCCPFLDRHICRDAVIIRQNITWTGIQPFLLLGSLLQFSEIVWCPSSSASRS